MVYFHEDEGISVLGALGAASPTFSPSDLSLGAWYDVSDSDTITESGGSVSQVDDKSGNGLHLVQGTASLQPTLQSAALNSLDTLRYDGSDDTTKSTTSITENPQVNTIYMVMKWISQSGTDNAFDGFGATDRQTYFANTSRHSLFAGSSFLDDDLISNGTWIIIKCIFNGASSEMIINETSIGSGNAGADGMAGVTLGSRQDGAQNSNIEFGEFVWVQDSVTGDDDTNMWNYLNDKWAVY